MQYNTNIPNVVKVVYSWVERRSVVMRNQFEIVLNICGMSSTYQIRRNNDFTMNILIFFLKFRRAHILLIFNFLFFSSFYSYDRLAWLNIGMFHFRDKPRPPFLFFISSTIYELLTVPPSAVTL